MSSPRAVLCPAGPSARDTAMLWVPRGYHSCAVHVARRGAHRTTCVLRAAVCARPRRRPDKPPQSRTEEEIGLRVPWRASKETFREGVDESGNWDGW
jgi:hypothetical protein